MCVSSDRKLSCAFKGWGAQKNRVQGFVRLGLFPKVKSSLFEVFLLSKSYSAEVFFEAGCGTPGMTHARATETSLID